MFDHKEVVSAELGDGEQLLWSGQPKQGVFLRGSDALLIPLSLMWSGVAIFWEYSVITSNASLFFTLWGAPFVLFGIYFVFGRFFVDSKLRERTFYGLTDKRVIILSGLFSKRTNSLAIRLLTDISLVEYPDGTGTVMLGRPSRQEKMYVGMAWPGMAMVTPRLECIRDAKRIYNKIRDIRDNHC